MKQQPVVTNFRIRPITYPDGHWMNRFWRPLASAVMNVVGRFPIYRYVLRAHPGAAALLDSGRPAIFACTHQDVFDTFNGLPRLLPQRPLAAMVSYSRDGGLAALGLQMLGYEVVRGSSSRGGGEGLMVLRANLLSGTSVVMVCDGPKAPLGDVKAGVVRLAASVGAPILPVRAWGTNRLRFHRSWTKAAVSLPGCTVAVCLGEPIAVERETRDTRPRQLAVARSLADLARWASRWADSAPVAPFEVAES